GHFGLAGMLLILAAAGVVALALCSDLLVIWPFREALALARRLRASPTPERAAPEPAGASLMLPEAGFSGAVGGAHPRPPPRGPRPPPRRPARMGGGGPRGPPFRPKACPNGGRPPGRGGRAPPPPRRSTCSSPRRRSRCRNMRPRFTPARCCWSGPC